MSHRRVLSLAVISLVEGLVGGVLAGCQGTSEPAPPRPPRPVIEARSATGAITARIVDGHPCRAEVDGDELLIGTEPLVAQIGSTRWSGDDTEPLGTTLRKDGAPIVRIHDQPDAGIEVFDAQGAAILKVASDGTIANARGEVLRKAAAFRATIKIGESVVTGTSDLALAVLVTAPELIPEVRALAVCHRLFTREQAANRR